MNFKDMTGLTEEQKNKIRENIKMLSLTLFTSNVINNAGTQDFYDEEYHNSSFIYKVLSKKLERFNIDVKVQDTVYMIIDICSQGNPLHAQLILWDILYKIKNLKPGYTVTYKDFVKTFPDYFPLLLYPNVKKEFEKRATELKLEDGGYPVDHKEFWNQIWS